MLNLSKIISELYPDKSRQELTKLLEDNQLFEPFKKTEIQLNELILRQNELKNAMGFISIGPVVTNLLITVNTRLKALSEGQKSEFEVLLSDLSKILILKIFELLHASNKYLAQQLIFTIEKTCEFQSYDKYQLAKYLNLEDMLSFMLATNKSEPVKLGVEKIPSLIWTNTKIINPLPEIFADHQLITNRKRLDAIFSQPEKRLGICFNPTKADIILQLFSFFKSAKLISYSNCKSIYDVFKYHILDFEKNILKNYTPRKRLNILHNSKRKWVENQKLIIKWLGSYSEMQTLLQTLPEPK